MTREQAQAQLNGMTLEDCIEMWNEHATDHYCRYIEIHETEDDDWWTRLAEEYGAHYLVYDIVNSVKEKTFCQYDEYFFYNVDDCRLYSFTDKQEMMKIIGEWFIEELINRKEE
jgi:hypothetical protein